MQNVISTCEEWRCLLPQSSSEHGKPNDPIPDVGVSGESVSIIGHEDFIVVLAIKPSQRFDHSATVSSQAYVEVLEVPCRDDDFQHTIKTS